MKSPGKLHHARWLTLANRVLRLYVSTPNPCNKLHDLVKIIMNCYAPGWFYIKFHPFVKDGPKNFWYLTKLVRKVDGKYSQIMKMVLFNNSYFAVPENIRYSCPCFARKTKKYVHWQ